MELYLRLQSSESLQKMKLILYAMKDFHVDNRIPEMPIKPAWISQYHYVMKPMADQPKAFLPIINMKIGSIQKPVYRI